MRVYAISQTALAIDMTGFIEGLKSGLKSKKRFEALRTV